MLFLSIRPKYVDLILAGTKQVELRRQVPRVQAGSALIYASSPRKELVGSFEISAVLNTSSELLWQRVRGVAGVSRDEFDAYFLGSKSAVGIWIQDVKLFPTPIPLDQLREAWQGFQPPQGFRYVADEDLIKLTMPEDCRAA